MENLPCDVVSNIFMRLLAKQLAQMRSVCKSWNALLSESFFIKSHLHRSIHNNNNDGILLFFNRVIYGDHLSSPGPLTARSSRSPRWELSNFMKLDFPGVPRHFRTMVDVIGSVNGLICFSYTLNRESFIRIWNPSLSVSLTLPPASLSLHNYYLAFGFDPKTDDYKVVNLASINHPNYNIVVTQRQVEVYSMRKGSWEVISQRIPSHIKRFITETHIYLNGHLYWLCVTNLEVGPGPPQTIVAFDLDAMTYTEIPLPDSLLHHRTHRSNVLGVLSRKLCVMSSVLGGEGGVWVMDDDESWVKHHVFSQFDRRITPHRFTSHNEFLFQVGCGSRFALYDPIEAKTKIFKIKMRRQLDKLVIFEYVVSLVWIAPTIQSNHMPSDQGWNQKL